MTLDTLTVGNMGMSFVGFGEAAIAFVAGWSVTDGEAIRAYDVKTNHADPQIVAAKDTDFSDAGIRGVNSAREALDGASIIFSMVTPDQANVAATEAAAFIAPNALFLDCNSCAPGTKVKSAATIEAAGGRYVDVAVMSPVHPALHKTPMLVSGPHAAAALEVARRLDMVASEAPGDVGTASSIKMIRSIMVKGMEALVLECVLSARKAGVEDVVLSSLEKTYPGFNWPERANYMMERVMTHGVRRAAEMREVAITVEDLGLDGHMSGATVDWQQRIGDLAMIAGEEDYKTRADNILAQLSKEAIK